MTSLESNLPRSGTPRPVQLAIIFVVVSVCVLAIWQFSHAPSIGDERFNGPQAQRIQQGDWTPDPLIVMPITYHAVVAGIARVFGVEGMQAYRIISVLLCIPAVLVFHLLGAHLSEPCRSLRTLQFFFLPVLFPYWFLVYTDAFSLLLLLLAFLMAQKRVDWAAGLFAIASTAVRQNNIIWLGLLLVLNHVRDHGWSLSAANLRSTLWRGWTFCLGIGLFAVFVVVNGGLAIGDKTMHPSFKLYSGNVFSAIFLLGVIFLPLHVTNLPSVGRLIGKHWWILPALVVTFFVFHLTFATDNPYHLAMQKLFINRVTTSVDRSFVWRIMFFAACAATLVSLAVTPLRSRGHLLLYPATILFLAPSWLIHARYYMIPFTLLLVFRKEDRTAVEIGNLIIMIGFAVAMLFFGLSP